MGADAALNHTLAETVEGVDSHRTGDPLAILALLTFIVAMVCVIFEESVHISKSKSLIMGAGELGIDVALPCVCAAMCLLFHLLPQNLLICLISDSVDLSVFYVHRGRWRLTHRRSQSPPLPMLLESH